MAGIVLILASLRRSLWLVVLAGLLLLRAVALSGQIAAAQPAYRMWVTGNAADVQTDPLGGVALMGGGRDIDAAFRWLVDRSDGGDIVIIRASGDDAYNPYLANLENVAQPADSVVTILCNDRAAAFDETVLNIVREAEALFIAGGDQSVYLRFWKDTPLETVITGRAGEGMVIGGTSAGADMLSGYI